MDAKITPETLGLDTLGSPRLSHPRLDLIQLAPSIVGLSQAVLPDGHSISQELSANPVCTTPTASADLALPLPLKVAASAASVHSP